MNSQLVCTCENSESNVNRGIFWRSGGCPSTLVVCEQGALQMFASCTLTLGKLMLTYGYLRLSVLKAILVIIHSKKTQYL